MTVKVIGVLSGVALVGLLGFVVYDAIANEDEDEDEDFVIESLPSGGFRPPFSGDGE